MPKELEDKRKRRKKTFKKKHKIILLELEFL
jgi:hypothetical protein